MGKHKKINVNLEQFKKRIAARANTLRRHGILDSAELNKSTYKPTKARKKVRETEGKQPSLKALETFTEGDE